MLSTAIQSSLSQLFNLKVEYLTTIIHNGNSLFLIIGNTSLILMDEKFETLKSKISFQCIERIIISSKDQYLFQVHFNNKKPNHVPQKMNIHCLERRTIVRLIKYGWKTDYMSKFLEVRELPMYKAGFKDYVSPADMLKPPKVELFKQIGVQGFKTFTHMGYQLTLGKTFNANQTQKGVYEDKIMGAEFILQITEKYPIEILHYVGDRRDLQYYAENYVHSLLQGEQYWFIDSSVFRKRRNLYNDTAEWTGWQVHARSKDRDYMIILQRRKYIPPFFDSFTDFILTLKAPKGFKPMHHKNQEDEEDQEQPEAEDEEEEDEEDEDNEGGKNAAEDYKKAVEQLYLEFSTQNIARDAADTITAIENLPVDQCYLVFLQFLTNNLIFDETTTLFLKNKIGREAAINEEIRKYFLEPIKALEKGGEGQQLKLFDNFSNFLPKMDGDSKGLRRHFNYKLSRHLGMCFDGGLISELTLHKFINLMQVNNKPEMLKTLDYFLYCISESQGQSSDLIPEENIKKVVKITQQKYIFNERVLSTLLEGKIIIDELLKKDNEQYYVDLMVFLIVYGKSTRYSACKHLIDYWADSQNNIPENLINLLKALVAPLLILYQTDNPKLSTMACLCLINMCAVSKDYKYQITKENGIQILIDGLKSINQSQLHYTLKLIFSLMSIVQHIEEFCQKGILDKITHILSQPDIPGAFYSPQAQTMACKIIYRCITKENDFLKQLPILMELAAVRSDIYNTDIRIIDRLKAEALNTIFRILTINKDFTDPFNDVQQTLIPYIIDIVQLEISEPLKIAVVKLLNIMIVKNKQQYATKWEKDKIEEHITKFEQEGIPGSDFLMKELTSL